MLGSYLHSKGRAGNRQMVVQVVSSVLRLRLPKSGSHALNA